MKLSIFFFVFLLLVNTVSASENASVLLHGEKTDVVLGEDIILKLSAINIITNPVMTGQVILIPPSGMSVISSDFVTSGAGQFTSTFNLDAGAGKDIEVRIKTNQAGDFNVGGRVIYYFGNDKSTKEDYSVDLPIVVRAPPIPTKAPPIEIVPKFGTSTLILIGIITLLLLFAAIYILRENPDNKDASPKRKLSLDRIAGKNYGKILLILISIILLILIAILWNDTSSHSGPIDDSDKNVAVEKAMETMNHLYDEIRVNKITPDKRQVNLAPLSGAQPCYFLSRKRRAFWLSSRK